jgi:hypothetical protein
MRANGGAFAGQLQGAGVDLRHDLVQQPSLDHAVHRVPRGHRPGIGGRRIGEQ